MKPTTATVLVLVGAYILAVAQNDWLIRNQPRIARFFAPPAFQFSQNIFEGDAAPFQIYMSEAKVRALAASAGLVRENCNDSSRIVGFGFPPALCFSYPLTGTFWHIWTQHGSIVGVRIYTTTNVEI